MSEPKFTRGETLHIMDAANILEGVAIQRMLRAQSEKLEDTLPCTPEEACVALGAEKRAIFSEFYNWYWRIDRPEHDDHDES